MGSSSLKCIAGGRGDAKTMGQMNQRSQYSAGIGGRRVHGVVGEQIGGTALLVESAEAVAVGGQGTLRGGVGNAGVEHLEGRVEEDGGGRVAAEQFAIGGLEEGSAAQGENRRAPQSGEDEVELMMLDGAESAFAAGGEEFGNGAVDAGNLGIQIDQRTGKLLGEETAERALARPHEPDEDEQWRWRKVGH